MKGLSVLFTFVLLAAAQVLAVQLRHAHALPAPHASPAAPSISARNTPRTPVPANAIFEL